MLKFLCLVLSIACVCHAQDAEVSIVFNQEPEMKGMTFVRESMKPAKTESRGKTESIWLAQQGSSPGVPWGRSVRMSITDPRFKNGKMPVVDVEITYRNNANAPVEFFADTMRRSARIGGGYGKDAHLQTVTLHLEDAFFGGRSFGNPPDKMQTDGFDLRINAFNEDFEIHSIRVRGYDLDNKPNYARLLKVNSVKTDTDDVFLFHPDQKEVLRFAVQNSARKAFSGNFSFVLKDAAEKILQEKKGDAEFAGSDITETAFELLTNGLPLGIYYVEFKLWPKAAPDGKPLIEQRSSIGIASATKLRKAKPGEFLYGIDGRLGGAYHNPRLLRWMELMGANILRHGFDAEDNLQEVEKFLPIYDKAGIQVMFICGAPWNENAAERDKTIAHRAQFLENLTGRFKQIRYLELGNEPDLKFFYGGPMDNYVADYTKLYDAVKRGNPETIVTNGGLCFFGNEGVERARRFIEVIDPSKIDAFAYHGHGPGVESERNAFERIEKTTIEFKKTGKPFIETESGMAAKTLAQQHEQARTVVEKMVFAQSERMPLFMWFRLLMFEEDYGSLNSEQQPRPVILAYRNMVETLRDYTFAQTLDLGTEGVEAYLFKQNDGPGRICVLWSNQPAFHTAYLAVGQKTDAVKNPQLVDLFGNTKPAELLDNGVIRAAFSEDPSYLKWETADPGFVVKKAPSMIDLPPNAQLVFNTANRVSVNLRNPYDRVLTAVLNVAGKSAVPVKIEPSQTSLNLAPRESRRVDLNISLEKPKDTLAWPEDWTVFLNVQEKDLDLSQLTSVPETLVGTNGQSIKAERIFTRNNQIDFTQLGANVKERAAAILFATVESDSDQKVTIGAGADWWMAWYVNGKPAYENLETGNGGSVTMTSHTFEISLRKGTNLLAVKVLCGSGGWKFAVGNPAALTQARSSKSAIDHLELTLSANDKILAAEKLTIQYTPPIPMLGDMTWNDLLVKWEKRKPTVVYDETSVQNFHDKFPDATRWWQGLNDLSGRVWITSDATRIYYLIKVIDDSDRPGTDADHDSVQLAFSRDEGNDYNEYLIGRKARSPFIQKMHSSYGEMKGELPPNNPEINASVERVEASPGNPGVTLYRISLDRKAVGTDSFFTNILVNDNDLDVRKQILEWRSGLAEIKEPKLWFRATLEK